MKLQEEKESQYEQYKIELDALKSVESNREEKEEQMNNLMSQMEALRVTNQSLEDEVGQLREVRRQPLTVFSVMISTPHPCLNQFSLMDGPKKLSRINRMGWGKGHSISFKQYIFQPPCSSIHVLRPICPKFGWISDYFSQSLGRCLKLQLSHVSSIERRSGFEWTYK